MAPSTVTGGGCRDPQQIACRALIGDDERSKKLPKGHPDDATTDLSSAQRAAATAVRRADLHGSPTLCQIKFAGRNTSHGDYQALWTHALKSVPEAQYPILVSARWVSTTQATFADEVQAHVGYEEEILRLS